MAKFYKFNKNLQKPSVIDGVSKMADFGSLKERYFKFLNMENADYHALLSDWIAIGDDIQKSYDIVTGEIQETN